MNGSQTQTYPRSISGAGTAKESPMRNFALHALVLSLVALMGCAGENVNDNTGAVNSDDVTNPDGTTDGDFLATLAMSAPADADTGITFLLDGEPVESEVEVNTEDGFTYEVELDWEGFLTVTHEVYLEQDDAGETVEVSWSNEGTYGADTAWWCTDEDGDSHFIESFIEEVDGIESVYISIPLNPWTILTGTEFSGEVDGSSNVGHIDLENASIHFQQWYDGEIWREANYTDCHE